MNLNQETFTTLIEVGKQLAIIAGAVGTAGSLLAGVLPPSWAITQLLARLFADTRDIRSKGNE